MKKKIIFITLIIGMQIVVLKNFAEVYLTDLLAIVGFIYMCLSSIKNKKFILLPNKLNILYIMFVIFLLISSIMLGEGIKSLIKWIEFYILIWGLFIVIQKYFNEMDISRIIIYSNYLALILSIVQYLIGNNNSAKVYLAASSIQIISSWLILDNKHKFLSSFGAIIAIIMSVILKSRTNTLGIAILILILIISKIYNIIKYNRVKIKTILIANVSIIIFLLLIVFKFNILSPFFDVIETLNINSYKTASNTERQNLISKSINIIKENPVEGIGEKNVGMYLSGENTNLTVHNTFLQIGIENGLIVMSIFIIIMIYTWYLIKLKKETNIYYKYIYISFMIVIYELLISPFSGPVRIRYAIILSSIIAICCKKNNIYILKEKENRNEYRRKKCTNYT